MNYLVNPVEIMLAGSCTCYNVTLCSNCGCYDDCTNFGPDPCTLAPCHSFICILA